MQTADKPKKITLATIKSFVKRNRASLLINCTSTFDGMQDGVRDCKGKGEFTAILPATYGYEQDNLGIQGAWFVGSSRDSFSLLVKEGYLGYRIYNCCGSFELAIKIPDYSLD